MLRDAFELVSTGLLLVVAAYAFRGRRSDATRFSLVAGLGTLGLAVDEFANLHERLGHAAYYDWGWPQPPVVNHYDDAFLMVIALAGLGTVAYYQRQILGDRSFATLFMAGLALYAAAIAWDSRADPSRTSSWWTEETLEFAGAAVMVAGFKVRLRGFAIDDRVAERALFGAPAESEP